MLITNAPFRHINLPGGGWASVRALSWVERANARQARVADAARNLQADPSMWTPKAIAQQRERIAAGHVDLGEFDARVVILTGVVAWSFGAIDSASFDRLDEATADQLRLEILTTTGAV